MRRPPGEHLSRAAQKEPILVQAAHSLDAWILTDCVTQDLLHRLRGSWLLCIEGACHCDVEQNSRTIDGLSAKEMPSHARDSLCESQAMLRGLFSHTAARKKSFLRHNRNCEILTPKIYLSQNGYGTR